MSRKRKRTNNKKEVTMKLKPPENIFAIGTIIKINIVASYSNCDTIMRTSVRGRDVIVPKRYRIGMRGVYFPLGTILSEAYLSTNNLYKNRLLNVDPTKKPGYFEFDGMVRKLNFRTHNSYGFLTTLSTLLPFATLEEVASLKDGEIFDQINGIPICIGRDLKEVV